MLMCLYVYVFIYCYMLMCLILICLYVFMLMCSCACMLVCLCVCMLVCLYVCMLVCLYVCMFICLYAYMLICLYAYMLTWLYDITHTHTHTHTHTEEAIKNANQPGTVPAWFFNKHGFTPDTDEDGNIVTRDFDVQVEWRWRNSILTNKQWHGKEMTAKQNQESNHCRNFKAQGWSYTPHNYDSQRTM